MKSPSFQVYPAQDGYRWRLRAANGRIIAESGEAYVTHRGAEQGIERVIAACADGTAYVPVDQRSVQ